MTEIPQKRAVFHRSYRHLAVTPWQTAGSAFCGLVIDLLVLRFAPRLIAFHEAIVRGLLEFVETPIRLHEVFMGGLRMNGFEVLTYLPSRNAYSAILSILSILGFVLACFPLSRLNPWKVIVAVFFLVLGTSSVFFFFVADRFPYSLIDFSTIWVFAEFSLWLLIPIFFTFLLAPLPLHPLRVLGITVACVAYAILFSALRLAALLNFFHHAGLIWMATGYFMFGFLADFLYVVSFYAIAVSAATKNVQRHQELWRW